ncbi:hypothetical protein EHS25_005053 [Saitozyma podzolica]|uniref:non-specific serine/threonine protein kinase n=1 Tax=Saitozyma podzolica TaxID=1890683 RepID=A0A427Y270_9TREE|nr:hypothetical protein EHS25_005053 [Saitozyma podzolica]
MNAHPAAGGDKANGHDRHSEIAPDLDVDIDADGDGDGYESSEGGSYHSGDSSDFEMDHRPVLERTAVKRDIRDFEDSIFLIRENGYKVIDRLGEGTFSSVYLARDSQHDNHDNSYWSKGKPVAVGDVPKERSDVKVAIKKILVTSSPGRITNELQILETLRGCRNVSQLITAYRDYDQVVIVLPYHRSDDFRHFYRHMDPTHIKMYMLHLLQGLKDIHRRGIVHRDIKPANFLFDYESGTGVICDFGLAERYIPPRRATCQHAPATQQFLSGQKQKTPETAAVEQALYDARKRSRLGEGRVGFPQDDKRPSIKTNRAGTRGFRAPEVLLKCPDQTVAIDVWSAGIMLLSILTHKFPVFNSNDDVEALMEIAAIFGRDSMERCALLHNRTIISNVPTVDHAPESLTHLVLKLNPHLYTPQISQPTPRKPKSTSRMSTTRSTSARGCSGSTTPSGSPRRSRSDTRFSARIRRIKANKTSLSILERASAEGSTLLIPMGSVSGTAPAARRVALSVGLGFGSRLTPADKAVFEDRLVEMQFGMGLPSTNQDFCPEHEHYQQRTLWNPVANARQWYGPGDDDGQPEGEEQEEEDEEERFVHADDLDLDVDAGEYEEEEVPLAESKLRGHGRLKAGGLSGKRVLAERDGNVSRTSVSGVRV